MTSLKSEQLTQPHYRTDIDGLRAIAVLSVLGFHAFPNAIQGGFVGVDIFFVISGFLISTIIHDNLINNSFSFIEFYSRRIRRIFPALLLLLLTGFILAWFLLLADEFKQLAKHIAGSAGFIANFIFWQESGYFDNIAETKPLLHLWSLGIEEQFYLIWPFLLWSAHRFKLNSLCLSIIIFVLSFSFNSYQTFHNAVAAFYSPQTRFWELILGGFLALSKRNTFIILDKNSVKNSLSVLGFVFILSSVFLLNKENTFPGYWALLPTLGTFFIILAGMQAWLNKIVFSNRFLVWIGLISYPLYLWHWLLLSFARIVESQTPTIEIRLAALVLAVVLASLTYLYLEKPIRFGEYKKEKTLILFLLMMGVISLGYNTYKQNGFPTRKAAQLQAKYEGDIGHDIFHEYMEKYFYLCTPVSLQKDALLFNNHIRCFQSKPNEVKDIAVIGDSHAEHLFLGLADFLQDKNIVYYAKNKLPHIDSDEFKAIFDSVIADPHIKVVILSAIWNIRLHQVPEGSNFEQALIKTINALNTANKTVYLTEDVPNFSFEVKKCKYTRVLNNNNVCSENSQYFLNQYQIYYQALRNIAANTKNTKLLAVTGYFCDMNYCNMTQNNKLLFRDANHLNIYGSRYLAYKLINDNPTLFK